MRDNRGKRRGCTGCLAAAGIGILILAAAITGLAAFIFSSCSKISGSDIENVRVVRQVDYRQMAYEGTEAASHFYYKALTDEDKRVYRELLFGINNHQEEILVHSGDPDGAHDIFMYVLKDNPQIFWVSGNSKSELYKNKNDDVVCTSFQPEYILSREERETRSRNIETEVEECLLGVSKDASEYEKILYVYEYLVNCVEYDLNAADNQNICSVFLNKKSVCAGYSKAAQLLLRRMGVYCIYVTGTANDGQNHAWNIVSCQGDYYNLDVTWGDPVFLNDEGAEIPQDSITYDYMCCDDRSMAETHRPDQEIALPKCETMDMNYYVVNGMCYESYDSDETLAVLYGAVKRGDASTTLKYTDREVYEEAKDDICNDVVNEAAQYLAEFYGLEEVTYRYMLGDEQQRITIFWSYD